MARNLFVVGALLALGCGAPEDESYANENVFQYGYGADEQSAHDGDELGELEQAATIVLPDGFGSLELSGTRCQLPTWPERCMIPLSRARKVYNAISFDTSTSAAIRNLSNAALNAVIAKVNSVGHGWSGTSSATNNNITLELKQLASNGVQFVRGIQNIDHLPAGEINQYKTCHIQIDPDFIVGRTSAFIDNLFRQTLYRCAGLGRGGNGLMSSAGIPSVFADITAQELGFLQQFNP